SKEEFEATRSANPDIASLYTVVVRDADEGLRAVAYHEAFREQLEQASGHLLAAAEYADDEGLKNYLTLRAEALLSGEYQESDLAWMDMKSNTLDVVIGPIETYEDQLFGYKSAAEAYVLVKDLEWSERLSRYAALLPMLQEGLPVPEEYKQETPGTDSDLNAYDAIYYAGDSNAGSKTIAINLPNDEEVQLQKGTRRLQLKNVMRAKFDKILVPIADVLIAEEQRQNITFDAFFGNTMFHEVAHGLGIKQTLDGSGTVRSALKEHASALEEGKADILGLYMITKLQEEGELDIDLEDNMVTFLAGIFRSTRFGASSAHGRANMIRFNFFREMGAFTRDEATGTYSADFERMQEAKDALTEKILRYQGDGDYAGVAEFVSTYGRVGDELQRDLDRLAEQGIPVDVIFEQGYSVLGASGP
ncbi:MAG: Zn-dependent hydrolase, partial [Rhodothermales bacterium]|nr:Zn-dependent hydrolase [Rhodothermales bacterium]